MHSSRVRGPTRCVTQKLPVRCPPTGDHGGLRGVIMCVADASGRRTVLSGSAACPRSPVRCPRSKARKSRRGVVMCGTDASGTRTVLSGRAHPTSAVRYRPAAIDGCASSVIMMCASVTAAILRVLHVHLTLRPPRWPTPLTRYSTACSASAPTSGSWLCAGHGGRAGAADRRQARQGAGSARAIGMEPPPELRRSRMLAAERGLDSWAVLASKDLLASSRPSGFWPPCRLAAASVVEIRTTGRFDVS
jgi:hypothetical protein